MHVVPANLSANNGMKIRNPPLAESSRTKRNVYSIPVILPCTPSFHFPRFIFYRGLLIRLFPRRRIFLLWVRISFISIPSFSVKIFYLSFLRFFQNSFVLETEKDSSSPDENHQPNSTTSISKLRLVRLICVTSLPRFFESQLRVTLPLKQETNGDHVHTQESRVHHFFFSRTVTRQRHNYIIRCTLLPWCRHRGPVAHATPCARTHGNR